MLAGANPLSADNDGHLPIHIYTEWRQMGLVAELVTRWRVPVDARTFKDETSLHIAHDYASVRALLELGAEPSAVDRLGRTPMDFALHRTPVDHRVLSALLNAGGYWCRSPLVVRLYYTINIEESAHTQTHTTQIRILSTDVPLGFGAGGRRLARSARSGRRGAKSYRPHRLTCAHSSSAWCVCAYVCVRASCSAGACGRLF